MFFKLLFLAGVLFFHTGTNAQGGGHTDHSAFSNIDED